MTGGWLEISLCVADADPDEVAGALADEFCVTAQVEGERIKLWLPDGEDRAAEEVKDMAAKLFPIATIYSVDVSKVENSDWLAKWKESVRPIPIGDRLRIVPSWMENKATPDRIDIVIDPGLAFGTGHHPATEGCMVMIEKYIGHSCLDVGCGSGILGITAALLGAKKVVCVDTDLSAVEIALQNVELNGVEDRLTALHGSVEKVSDKFDLVVANLYLTPLVELAPAFVAHLAEEGFLIVAGFTKDQEGQVTAAMGKEGLAPTGGWKKNEWVTLVFQRATLAG